MTDNRPADCRFRLRDEGKPYPRSSCRACGKSISTGLGQACSHAVPRPTPAPGDPTGFAWTPELYQAVQMIGLTPLRFSMDELLTFYKALNGAAIFASDGRPAGWTEARALAWCGQTGAAPSDAGILARLFCEGDWDAIKAEFPDFVEWMDKQ